MTKAQQLEARARKLTAAQGTRQLVEAFELSDELLARIDADYRATADATVRARLVDDRDAVTRSRGWMIDELDARDAAAFERYLDGEATLAAAFGIAR